MICDIVFIVIPYERNSIYSKTLTYKLLEKYITIEQTLRFRQISGNTFQFSRTYIKKGNK